jgi:hypothetical protein
MSFNISIQIEFNFHKISLFFHQVIIIGSAQLQKAQVWSHIQIISEIDTEDNDIQLSISKIEYNIETNSYQSNLMVWNHVDEIDNIYKWYKVYEIVFIDYNFVHDWNFPRRCNYLHGWKFILWMKVAIWINLTTWSMKDCSWTIISHSMGEIDDT